MKKVFLLFGCWLLVVGLPAQTVSQKLQKAFLQFENDSQLKHAISSLYVIDAATGKVVFDKNSQIGLAPASTQKIITAATAFELLGKDFKYRTDLGYNGIIRNGSLNGRVFILSSGDPTFGSWRWKSTEMDIVLEKFSDSFKRSGIKSILGEFVYETGKWETQKIPDVWIWQDVGNYYGAGASILNWHENQYDLFLKSGKNIGDSVIPVGTYPEINERFVSEAKSAEKSTGDNAYIYFPLLYPSGITVRGTIPVDEKRFKISGTIIYPYLVFCGAFVKKLKSENISVFSGKHVDYEFGYVEKLIPDSTTKTVCTHYSPSLDSIIYWFLKKSVNLYGEALIKTFAYEKKGFGSTEGGVDIVKKFWKEKDIDDDELNIYDGSGLSPQNRVTTHAQVEILKFAKKKDWFPYFFDALPEYNGMKMKSGTIRDVKGFCGYHKAKDGKEYIFSFLVNNYNGRTSGVVNEMFKVLDELKAP